MTPGRGSAPPGARPEARDPAGGGAGRLGVVGTLVWDTIHGRDPGRDGPVEEWGGIAYSLSAFEAAGPGGWRLLPIVKVGEDVRDRARGLLEGLERVESLEGVRFVDAPNNRVELRYRDDRRRTERLRGGVPGWGWDELAPLVASCDALYVNFIAGWEMDLPAARRLRGAVAGPVYADLHSLFLDVGPDGVRRARPPERGAEWASCFDYVQVNEEELRLLYGGTEAWEAARRAVAGGQVRALLVTRGPRGARWVEARGLRLPGVAGEGRPSDEGSAVREGGVREVSVGEEPAAAEVDDPDPTGCGDVWGIVCFGSLLAGSTVREAVRRANRVAARNARLRGGRALAGASGADPATGGGEGT